MANGMMLHAGGKHIARQNLINLDTPVSDSPSHVILPHHDLVDQVLEKLAMRNVNVVKDEYATAKDGLRLFGMLTLDIMKDGVNLVMGLRNSHDKSFSLGIVAGFRVFVCDNLAFSGDFEPLARKHSKNLMKNLPDALSIGLDRVQGQFGKITDKIDRWKDYDLSDDAAQRIIYRAFVMGELDAPERLAGKIHKEYFEPRHEEFSPRNAWSLHNAFTQIFGDELDPMPQYKALSSLDSFLAIPGKSQVVVPDVDAVFTKENDDEL